jgi:hypothetical protein
MPNDVDTLMALVHEINHKTPPLSADDITTIIAYHRLSRQRKASGEKVPKTKADTTRVLANLDLLMGAMPKSTSKPLFKLKASS